MYIVSKTRLENCDPNNSYLIYRSYTTCMAYTLNGGGGNDLD